MMASPEAGGEGVNLQHGAGRHGAQECVFQLFTPTCGNSGWTARLLVVSD